MTSWKLLDHMADPVLALRGETIAATNEPARSLFDVQDTTFEGTPLGSLFASDTPLAERYADSLTHYHDAAGIVEGGRRHFYRDHPAIDQLLAGDDPEAADPDIGLFIDGSLKYYHLTTSSLDDADIDGDRLVTFREITHLKDRERALDSVVIDAVNDVANNEAPEAEFAIEIPDVTVEANPELPRALEHCIENGAIYSEAETPRVSISAVRDGPWVLLEIADNGPGIPKKELETLTEHGETDLVHGSGAGLWLTYTVIQESGGNISYDTEGDETTVRIRLPRA